MGMSGRNPTKVTPFRRNGWLALGIAAATALAFLPVLRNGFVSWDDEQNFVTNLHYRGLGWANLRWMWTTTHMGHYVPLTWMTLGGDYLLWGMRPAGYHLTSLLLHAANAALCFLLARRLLAAATGGEPGARELVVPAAAAALCFAIHPLRVESVAWATERRDVLSGCFYFLALLTYLRAAAGARGRAWYALSLLAFAAALLSKAIAVTLPAVLLILDVYPLRRLGGASGWWGPAARRVYAEKVPFGLLALAASAMAFRALGDVAPQLDPAGKVAVSAWSLVFYLRKTVLPLGLSPLYPMPRQVLPLSAPFLLAGGAVLLAAGACWALRRRWPAVPAAMLAFGVILLPVLGIHQNGPQIAADRYTYLAGGAVALLAGAAVRAGRARFGGVADGVALLAVLALGLLTWRQAGVWRDSGSLWSQAVAVAPESSIARNNWGNALAARGRLAEAAAEYREALRLDPEYAEAHNDLGVVLARTGDPAGAIAQYRQALAFRPRYGEAEGNWGVALSLQGDLAGAIERYRRAIAINPEDPEPEVNWGNALVRQGQFEEAMAHYARALEVAPGNASAHHNWGVALVQAGRVADAIGHFRQAVALDPGERLYQEHLRRAEELLASPRP